MSSLALLYLLLGAEFIAMAQMIVYGGAVMVLFIFVIMLLNAGAEKRSDKSLFAQIAGFPLLAVLGCVVVVPHSANVSVHRVGSEFRRMGGWHG